MCEAQGKKATGELWDGSVQGGQQIFVFRGFLALKSDVKHRLVKSYHLYSHIFRPEFPKYNLALAV